VREIRFNEIYNEMIPVTKGIREVELPFANQIGPTGKYLTLINVDGVLRIKNFSDLKSVYDYKNL
jgi:hypothetical protein